MIKKANTIGKLQMPADMNKWPEFMDKLRADPEQQAWKRLAEILNQAVVDPQIRESDSAEGVAQFLRDLVFDIGTASAHDFAALVESRLAAWRAKRKGHDARAWVKGEWKRLAGEYDKNKAEFARVYSRLVLKEKKYSVTARTIETRWLD